MRPTEPYRAVATPTPIVALRGRARCVITARTHEDPFICASRLLHEESRYVVSHHSITAMFIPHGRLSVALAKAAARHVSPATRKVLREPVQESRSQLLTDGA